MQLQETKKTIEDYVALCRANKKESVRATLLEGVLKIYAEPLGYKAGERSSIVSCCPKFQVEDLKKVDGMVTSIEVKIDGKSDAEITDILISSIESELDRLN
ncbi:hypothetical protein [Ferrimonas sp. YFM]|uniref:hypothetical protein n=1 Tax=Ferrimonas sp. YFM TaxID=3028878 RepID=UPI002572F16D|nr:hypothetical protein [Ferrimonas sp. YFM]BDY05123.1 hypothetical protein F0521_21640 [Ferrimonas sp. YFM]